MLAIRALGDGFSQAQVASILGASPTSVSNWVNRYRSGGKEQLLARPRGRPPRRSVADAEALRQVLLTKTPEQMELVGSLWTWRNVQALICRSQETEVSRWTVMRRLREIGFEPPSPVEANAPERMKLWMEQEFPRLRAQAQADGAQIYFVGPGRMKRRPGDPVTVWAVNSRGEAAFMTWANGSEHGFIAAFLRRLSQEAGSTIVAVTGAELVPDPRQVREALADGTDRIRIEMAP